MTDMTFERRIVITGAYDKRHPEPSKNYGIHGMDMCFYLIGPRGAVQFVFYSAQHLKHVANELRASLGYNPFHGMGADIGYHAITPQYQGQECGDCTLLPGGKCYYDGSGLAASEFEDEFVAGGSEIVWPMLKQKYNEWFGES
jgi:hypothetical protein